MQNCISKTSDLVKEKIKETGIKQVHLAKKLGISPQHLNKILAKSQNKSQYLPKIAEILGIDQIENNSSNIKLIPILEEDILKSLLEETTTFDEIEKIKTKIWPMNIPDSYYFFGLKLKENINSQLIKNDLLIFSTSLPYDMTGRIGIAYIKLKSLIFIGNLKYNGQTIIIYNESDCFEFILGDQLLGIAVRLERNMEKELK